MSNAATIRPGASPPLLSINLGPFPLRLHRRTLIMGRAGEIEYFWMDSRTFRSGPGSINLRSCIDAWWEAMGRFGLQHDLDNQINLAMAELFPLVNTSKATQDVFLDAHLGSTAGARDDTLDTDAHDRLRALVDRRNPALVREEFGRLFLGELPPADRMHNYQEAFRHWAGNAAVQLRRRGVGALRSFLATSMTKQIAVYRRRGDAPEPRRFVNMVAYEAKAAFYRCYANAWLDLVPGLASEFKLNPASARFMRLWHGLGHEDARRDMFWGQVLALHPLSAFVMERAEHRFAIGEWLAEAQPGEDTSHLPEWSSPAYRGALAAVLTAAAEYKLAWQRQQERRSPRRTPTSRRAATQASPAEQGQGPAFELYAASKGMVCPQCSTALAYKRHRVNDDGRRKGLIVEFTCTGCGSPQSVDVDEAP